MLWIKSFHIIAVVAWFAGLFYLPRLFSYHAAADDAPSVERFKVMERKLYYGVMAPAAIAAVVFGAWLWMGYGIGQGQRWLLAKLALVVLLVIYHLYCGMLLDDFRHDRNSRPSAWFRWFSEFPALVLVGAVLLAVVKPF